MEKEDVSFAQFNLVLPAFMALSGFIFVQNKLDMILQTALKLLNK